MDDLLTIDEAAAEMRMSSRYVRRLVAERRIAFVKLGRCVRLARADVRAYVAAGRVEPMTESQVWRGLRSVA